MSEMMKISTISRADGLSRARTRAMERRKKRREMKKKKDEELKSIEKTLGIEENKDTVDDSDILARNMQAELQALQKLSARDFTIGERVKVNNCKLGTFGEVCAKTSTKVKIKFEDPNRPGRFKSKWISKIDIVDFQAITSNFMSKWKSGAKDRAKEKERLARLAAQREEERRIAALRKAELDAFLLAQKKKDENIPFYILRGRLKKAARCAALSSMINRYKIKEKTSEDTSLKDREARERIRRQRQMAAAKIQSRARGRQARSQMRQRQLSARKLQAHYRGYWNRRIFKSTLFVSKKLQSVWRGRRWRIRLWALINFASLIQKRIRGYVVRRRERMRQEMARRVMVHMIQELEAKHGVNIHNDLAAIRRIANEARRLVAVFYTNDPEGLPEDDEVSFFSESFKVPRIRGTKPFKGRLSYKQWRLLCSDLILPWKNKTPEQYSYIWRKQLRDGKIDETSKNRKGSPRLKKRASYSPFKNGTPGNWKHKSRVAAWQLEDENSMSRPKTSARFTIRRVSPMPVKSEEGYFYAPFRIVDRKEFFSTYRPPTYRPRIQNRQYPNSRMKPQTSPAFSGNNSKTMFYTTRPGTAKRRSSTSRKLKRGTSLMFLKLPRSQNASNNRIVPELELKCKLKNNRNFRESIKNKRRQKHSGNNKIDLEL